MECDGAVWDGVESGRLGWDVVAGVGVESVGEEDERGLRRGTASCFLLITYYWLPNVCCSLALVSSYGLISLDLTAYSSLFTVHCPLFNVHCVLFTAYCSLFTAHCSLRAADV